ncbi:MAG: hypothetical protein ACK5MJ_03225 [Alphaproteobacteria bacterium]
MQKKHCIFIGLSFLAISVLLVIYELITKKPKADYSHASEATSSYPFEELAHFIHNMMGYKLIFPALGLIAVAIISYLLAPILTKKEERP